MNSFFAGTCSLGAEIWFKDSPNIFLEEAAG